MAFFDKIGETITSASNNVAQKTKEMSEVSNLNKQVNANEGTIQNAYLEIGKIYYANNMSNPDPLYQGNCRLIQESTANVVRLKEQIRSIKGISICPNCGSELSKDSMFCQGCGYRVTPSVPFTPVVPVAPVAPVAPAAPVVSVTPVVPVAPIQVEMPVVVEAQSQPNTIFCQQCGNSVEKGSVFCMNCGQKM